MKKVWDIDINGVSHKIEFNSGFGYKLFIDGERHIIKSQSSVITRIDYPVMIDNTEIRLVINGKDIKLAVNGIYKENGKAYCPSEPISSLTNVLMIFSAYGGFFIGGLLGMIIGFFFAYKYVEYDVKNSKSTLFLSFAICTILQFVILVLNYNLLIRIR